MSEFSSSSNGINLAAVGMLSLLLVGGTFIVLRRRDNA
jgi:LPXTG-motif cell wall-anchored protein